MLYVTFLAPIVHPSVHRGGEGQYGLDRHNLRAVQVVAIQQESIGIPLYVDVRKGCARDFSKSNDQALSIPKLGLSIGMEFRGWLVYLVCTYPRPSRYPLTTETNHHTAPRSDRTQLNADECL